MSGAFSRPQQQCVCRNISWTSPPTSCEPRRGHMWSCGHALVGRRLRLLAEHAGRLFGKDDIIAKVWDDVAVTEDSLTQCIVEIPRPSATRSVGFCARPTTSKPRGS